MNLWAARLHLVHASFERPTLIRNGFLLRYSFFLPKNPTPVLLRVSQPPAFAFLCLSALSFQ